ncbi:MAG: putative DNA-binding domain-containing protein [Zetaproteobacteria bacterium]|nr:putative DNA-binding domain-containing protein [Zetaproteobacteria bacterium]
MLLELQKSFQKALTPAAGKLSPLRMTELNLQPHCSPSPETAIDQYRAHFVNAYLAVLAEVYTYTGMYLGQEPFQDLCRRYIRWAGLPSDEIGSMVYGQELEAYVRRYSKKADPELLEVIRLDGCICQSFYALDEVSVDLEKVRVWLQDSSSLQRISLLSSLRYFTTSVDLTKYEEDASPDLSEASLTPDAPLKYCVVVWKKDYLVYHRCLGRELSDLLQYFTIARTREEVLTHYCLSQDAAEQLQGFLTVACDYGWLHVNEQAPL